MANSENYPGNFKLQVRFETSCVVFPFLNSVLLFEGALA